MILPPLATTEELNVWLGLDVADVARAGAILAAASTLVRAYTGRVWIDENDVVEVGPTAEQHDAARTVVLIVAARVWTNPYGYTQESVGPYSRSVAAWAAVGLELTEAERSMLGTPPQLGVPGLSSLRVVAPADASATRHFDIGWWESEQV